MSGTGSLLDPVQIADTLGTAGVRSPQVSVLWGTVKHIRQGSRTISLLHSLGRSKVPSDVQQAVSRSGMSVRKLSLYTPAGRKVAGEGEGDWERSIRREFPIQIEAPIKKVYLDDIIFVSTNKELCTGFEKLEKDKFQMSSMGELTFFLGLQVQQKNDGIFISRDKYVAEILKKFNYFDVKSASTPVDLEKPLVKDGGADDVDVHLYRSMIGSLVYLTASRLDIMFAVMTVWPDFKYSKAENFYCQAKVNAVGMTWEPKLQLLSKFLSLEALFEGRTIMSICSQVWMEGYVISKSIQSSTHLVLNNFGQLPRRDLYLDDAEGTNCLPTATIFEELHNVFANMKRAGKDFSRRITPLFAIMMVQVSEEVGADSGHPTKSTQVPILDQPSTSSKTKKKQQSKKTQTQEEEVSQAKIEHEESVPIPSNDPQHSGENSMQLTDLMVFCTKLQTQVLDLEKAKDAQAKEIAALKKRIQRRVESSKDQKSLGALEDASKQGRSIADIDADAKVTLVNETQERQDNDWMFDSGVLEDDEMHVEAIVDRIDEQSTKPDDTPAGEAVTTASVEDSAIPTTIEEITLAQTLILIKAAKTKVERKDDSSSKKTEIAQIYAQKQEIRLESDESKKQKTDKNEEVEEDNEAELKMHMVIVKDDDIAIDAIPLATKPPMIIEHKIIKEGIIGHYQLIRADGSSKRYSSMIRMLQGI
ncbi:putative ribonuclease H-like domain-containing protein [Tanacetum coccineum]